MLVYQEGKTLARVGVMGESPTIEDAPILRKCLRDGRDGREQYLAALQVTCFLALAQRTQPLSSECHSERVVGTTTAYAPLHFFLPEV